MNKIQKKMMEKAVLKEMFVDLFNRVMRQFEKGLISLAYYMGPLLYGLNKYVKENPDFAISKNIELYRKPLSGK